MTPAARAAALAPSPIWWRRWELPTWGVAIAIYASWFALVWFHAAIPWPVEMLLGAYVLAWHFSLQHEAIHGWLGIPAWRRVGRVWPPIGATCRE